MGKHNEKKPEQTRASLLSPEASQKPFSVRDPSKPIRSGGFGQRIAATAIDTAIVVTGDHNVTISEGSVVGHDVAIQQEPDIPVLSGTQAVERIAVSARTHQELYRANVEKAQSESAQFHRYMLLGAALAFAVLVAAVILMLVGQVTAGVVSAVSGIIPKAAAYLLFRKDKELRDNIHTYQKHIEESQQILTMVDVAETISTSEERDSVKRDIIWRVLDIKP